MDVSNADKEKTNDADLVGWEQFSVAYYERIQRTFRLLRAPEADIPDLTQTFLLKVGERNFLEAFHAYRDRESQLGRRARFRSYLYRSLQHHSIDYFRENQARGGTVRTESAPNDWLAAAPEPALDPDALYALDVLHHALQIMRRHCERTGKHHYWVIFEETLLAAEFGGRRRKTPAELMEAFPDLSAVDLHNALTTAKRAFRRFVHEAIPAGPRDEISPAEKFAEWMEILRNSSVSQFNLLHVAYRVAPLLSGDAGEADSLSLIVNEGNSETGARPSLYEEPILVPSADEMSILLSFRLELPLTETLDVVDLEACIPSSSFFWPLSDRRRRMGARGHFARQRPLCLLTLIDPTPEEEELLAEVDVVGLLRRLKSFAKRLRRRPDHSVPEEITQLIYTIVNLIARTRCNTTTDSIGPALLADNVRWFLDQSWLDDRLRPLFVSGLGILEGSHQDAT